MQSTWQSGVFFLPLRITRSMGRSTAESFAPTSFLSFSNIMEMVHSISGLIWPLALQTMVGKKFQELIKIVILTCPSTLIARVVLWIRFRGQKWPTIKISIPYRAIKRAKITSEAVLVICLLPACDILKCCFYLRIMIQKIVNNSVNQV